jgi:hypothetical protein
LAILRDRPDAALRARRAVAAAKAARVDQRDARERVADVSAARIDDARIVFAHGGFEPQRIFEFLFGGAPGDVVVVDAQAFACIGLAV